MSANFLKYFYHDVMIREFSYSFNPDIENNHQITFILEDEEIENSRIKCIFDKCDVFYTEMFHRFIGEISIADIDVSEDDPFLLNYKEKMGAYASSDSLKCYCIYTTHADVIKIISSSDVTILDSKPRE